MVPLVLGLQNILHHLGSTRRVLIEVSEPGCYNVVTLIKGHEPLQGGGGIRRKEK